MNNAITSFTIAKASGTVMLSGGAATGSISAHVRSAGPVVVTVVGGGSITLRLRVQSER